ncbi:MAG: DNA methyltransferase [Dehalococcoidales bacterium]|nr:DNA methyltransferase [Dehalococcoidales bacterium]
MAVELNTNVLYFGDNLEILRKYIPDNSIDLIYLDPPFNSKKDYNILFKENGGVESEAQIYAFSDTWHWTQAAQDTYHEIAIKGSLKVGKLIDSLRDAIGSNDVMAYLVMMTIRLIELHRVLKPTGSLYLHCDPTASHYLKIILDQIFGHANFRNEIIWRRANAHNDPKRFGRISDTILYYAKSDSAKWNAQHTPYRENYYKSHYTQDAEGRFYRTVPLDAPRHGKGSPALLYEWHGKWPATTRTWAVRKEKMEEYEQSGLLIYTKTGTPTLLQYSDEMPGVLLQNIWTDIPPVNPQAKERLGYETQKPLALLERIISASSNKGDVVLDPFCGCGTAVVAAQKLNRKWIGIDITHLAINLMRNRLKDSFPRIKFEVIGEPKDLASARSLAHQDRYQFQYWAGGLIGARPPGGLKKKGADQGIDGIIPFIDSPEGKASRVIVQVKSGHIGVNAVRELTVVAAKEAIGVLITLEPPTTPMITEAISAGYYHSQLYDKDYPKIQILTIEELLQGKTVDMPSQTQTSIAFPKAPRVKKNPSQQSNMMYATPARNTPRVAEGTAQLPMAEAE